MGIFACCCEEASEEGSCQEEGSSKESCCKESREEVGCEEVSSKEVDEEVRRKEEEVTHAWSIDSRRNSFGISDHCRFVYGSTRGLAWSPSL